MASLKRADLDSASVLTVVMDKFGTRYFKLVEGTWASDALEVISAAALVKKRPVLES